MSTTATAKQLDFVGSLLRERARTLHISDVDAAITALREQRITMDGASATIERLLKLPKDPPVATPAADTRGNLPSNRYGGRCVLCGGNVAEGVGTYRRGRQGWETLHLPEQCPTLAAEPSVKRQTFAEAVTEIVGELADGYYAVAAVSGTNDLTFVRVATNKGVLNPAKKGQRFVRQIVGGTGEADNASLAWITKVIAAINAAGADASAILYGQQVGSCGFCGTELTRRYSRDQGYGPSCATKHGLPFDFKAYAASQVLADGGE